MTINIIKDSIKWNKLAFKTLKNPLEVLLFRIGLKNKTNIKTKTIGNFFIENNRYKINIISKIMKFQYTVLNNSNISEEKIKKFKKLIYQFCSDEKIIEIDGIKYLNNIDAFVLFEEFFEEGSMIFSELENKIAIDIGANIGDTALYFANNGCEVYAYEPVPDIFKIAIENINLNPTLTNKIHLFNYAVSDENKEIEIIANGSASSIYAKGSEKYKIKAYSLDFIINQLHEKNIYPNILKMDCEGSEFDIIPNSNLKIFEEISLEYHTKMTGIDKDILIKTLQNQDFEIKGIYKAPEIDIPIEEIGIIHAIKKK